MEKMLEIMKSRSEQFTPTEVQAEILRQQIQELKGKGIKDLNNPQTHEEIHLKALKSHLAAVQESAKLSSQGRTLMAKYWKMTTEFRESGEVGSEAGEILEKYKKWLDAMDKERTKQYQLEMIMLKQEWPLAGWKHRMQMIRWLGRHLTRRFVVEKSRYYFGRATMGWMMKMFTKGR